MMMDEQTKALECSAAGLSTGRLLLPVLVSDGGGDLLEIYRSILNSGSIICHMFRYRLRRSPVMSKYNGQLSVVMPESLEIKRMMRVKHCFDLVN